MYSKSLARVAGLQLTYIICFVQNFIILGRASGCIPTLGGSIISRSAPFHCAIYLSKKSSTFAFTNFIFFIQLYLAFFSPSLEDDLTNSTE
jgi:hypothetical protein